MRCDSRPCFESEFIQGLYNWQPLIGVVIAIVGAILLWRQITLADRHEEERKRRRFVAARAVMPLLLSGICEYSRQVAALLREVHAASGQHAFGAQTLVANVPTLPPELPAALERLIESTGNDKLATSLADILSELQVLNGRTTELPRLPSHTVGLTRMIEDYMLQAARTYAAASSLFDYARREVADPSDGEGMDVRSALNLLEMRDHAFEQLHQTARRRLGILYSSGNTGAISDPCGTPAAQ